MKGKRWVTTLGWAAGAAALAMMVTLVGVGAVAAAPPGPPPYPPGVVVYWVNDPGDLPDADGAGACDTGTGALPGTLRLPCTLRAAIQLANSDGGPSVIAFEVCPSDIPGFQPGSGGMLPTSEVYIQPKTPLPALITDTTYINGYTQGMPQAPGYDDPATTAPVCNGAVVVPPPAMPNTASFGQALNTRLLVAVEGALCVSPAPAVGAITIVPGGIVPSGSILQWNGATGACSGFTILSSKNVIAGLNIRAWKNAGILIMPGSTPEGDELIPTKNSVWGNYIGTDLLGMTTESSTAPGIDTGNRFGVEMVGGARQNYVGDTWDIRNWLMVDPAWVEEPTNAERNLISGNDNPVDIYGASCVQGGMPPLPPFYNDGAGVFLGVDPCVRANLAAGGAAESPMLTAGALETHVRNNYIGVQSPAEAALPNTNGVWLNYDAASNHIGGCVKFPFTVGPHAACDPQHDIDLEQDANLISGNQKLDGQGQSGGHGIWLNGALDVNQLTDGEPDVDFNEIGGNFIGVNGGGGAPLPNFGDGVLLAMGSPPMGPAGAPSQNEIGATTEYVDGKLEAGAYSYGNLISGNGNPTDVGLPLGDFDNGVELVGMGVDANRVGYGNVIGLDSQGLNVLGNGDNGVKVWQGATGNYIHNNSGGDISKPFVPTDAQSDAGAISANGAFGTATGRHGVFLLQSAARNAVFRNCIGGSGITCTLAMNLGNLVSGVVISDTSVGNTVGLNPTGGITKTAVAEPNWIHHNGVSGVGDGVAVLGETSDQNTIRFNAIWLNGNPAVGNLGIDLGDDGDTANDADDLDTGPNEEMNYPDAVVDAAHWIVRFRACTGCTVDIYATLENESDWNINRGEGRHWLTSTLVSSYGVSNTLNVAADITRTLGSPPGGNVCITLTATDVNGNTSEFSDCQDAHFNPTAVLVRALRSVGILPALLGCGLVLGGALGWRVLKRRRA